VYNGNQNFRGLPLREPLGDGFTVVYGVLPGEKRTPGWGAQWQCVVAVENDAVVSQGVDIWRRNLI
jgi:hypothetical protein